MIRRTLCLLSVLAAPLLRAGEPRAVPTFECVGLYWKPDGGAADNACSVRYRAVGETVWRDALPLWFDPTAHPGAPEHSLEYRGSVVGLKPGTAYEFSLQLAKGGSTTIAAKTWSEEFPIAKTVVIPANSPQPVLITEGGSQEGYVLYTADAGVVFDGQDTAENNVEVRASHVILRGLTLKGARVNGIELGRVQDVVVENCDISGWGRIAPDGYGENLDAAIFSKAEDLERIVIQGNKLHHPRSCSNSWTEDRPEGGAARNTRHPRGPQGITFKKSNGHLVIRRNQIYSDPAHAFNDGMGETQNFSYRGFPHRDSDIYQNEISHCYDDGIEAEGANLNVRLWSNSFDEVNGAIGAASPSLGPIYIWRNVFFGSRRGPGSSAEANKGGYLIKLGHEDEMWTKGRLYAFHNTMLQPPPREGFSETSGGDAGIILTGPKKKESNVVSRNNVLFLRDDKGKAVNDATSDPTNDFDYDLYVGKIIARPGSETHGIQAAPQFDLGQPGIFPLKSGSPGIDSGEVLPNFNDGYTGKAPDMGAFESAP